MLTIILSVAVVILLSIVIYQGVKANQLEQEIATMTQEEKQKEKITGFAGALTQFKKQKKTELLNLFKKDDKISVVSG